MRNVYDTHTHAHTHNLWWAIEMNFSCKWASGLRGNCILILPTSQQKKTLITWSVNCVILIKIWWIILPFSASTFGNIANELSMNIVAISVFFFDEGRQGGNNQKN